jgi:CheY-like chemotaxis protein
VESEPGGGTTFTLRFPVVTAPAVAEPPQAPTGRPAEPDAVILVVEDDEVVRRMTVRALSEAGFGTLEAEDGRAALRLIADRRERIDLVVTDLGMPNIDGYELARRLRAEDPGLPVLLISGHVQGGPTPERGAPWPLLRKPFPPEELLRQVAELLAGRRGLGRRSAVRSTSV